MGTHGITAGTAHRQRDGKRREQSVGKEEKERERERKNETGGGERRGEDTTTGAE